ncbi:hypothetical protein LAZ67_2002634 [Cordylochernes scorpioides]|uniref:Sidestep protein n=1 Tax=Cordylochernes scorpioides TaxID=51811 RepID=A0ABY6K2X1_9ARAC|nr:hypothetical protein LAZ67_2002634 [Cordylochernes scorpioides]
MLKENAPILHLRLGSKLRHSHIQEGNDVYLECSVRANPRATEVGWRFEGRELHTNTSAGVIVSNQSLVLQRVRRHARGRYTCTAANSEGRGESEPLYLRVQYAPICKSDQKSLYGVARHEPVQVSCEVESDPVEVDFQWRFNNSAESLDTVIFNSRLNRSVATYIPRNEYDYGSLLCWGRNSVGLQKEPCVFAVIPAGAPDPVSNCSVTNITEESFVVRCAEGYDGGLGQNFLLELMPLGGPPAGLNVSAAELPHFICRGLSPGIAYRIRVFAVNAKGRSRPAVMRAATLASPESLTQRDLRIHNFTLKAFRPKDIER